MRRDTKSSHQSRWRDRAISPQGGTAPGLREAYFRCTVRLVLCDGGIDDRLIAGMGRCRCCWSGLTVVTGLVDAFSFLRLGHVFVANMTGNVVFPRLRVGRVGEVSIAAEPSGGAGLRPRRSAGRAVGRRASGAPRAPTGGRHVGSGGPRSGRIRHRQRRRCARFGGAADPGRIARAGHRRPERSGTPPGRTRA